MWELSSKTGMPLPGIMPKKCTITASRLIIPNLKKGANDAQRAYGHALEDKGEALGSQQSVAEKGLALQGWRLSTVAALLPAHKVIFGEKHKQK